jgi:RNA polymerase sigma factor (sigma-70 family)
VPDRRRLPLNDGGLFPRTAWSAIEAVRSADPELRRRALERIVAIYWKPVYKYLRVRHGRSSADAEDLTQELFASLLDRGTLESYDPTRARLRTFLRGCIDALVANADRDARRLKRGGGAQPLSLEFELAEGELARSGPTAPASPDELFDREWVRSLFESAVEQLRADCEARGRLVPFTLFERYDLDEGEDRPTYADLARELGIAATDVTNGLAAARRELRRIVLDLLRETTSSDAEFRREARALLGHEPA